MALNDALYIKTLIDAGADAMSNLYYVEFLLGNESETSEGNNLGLTVRSGEFNPPSAFTHAADNEIHFITSSLKVPTASYSGDRSFDVSFRLDENYKLYSYLKALQAKTANIATGFAGMFVPGESVEDDDTDYFDIKVYAFKANSNPEYTSDTSAAGYKGYLGENKILMYHFQRCWITKIGGLEYSYESSSPLTITAGFDCQYYSGPGSDIALDNTTTSDFFNSLGEE